MAVIFVCFLDASKAFDRMDYPIFFSKPKLISRNIPDYIVRFWGCYPV